jgi:hypothetical protein
METKEPVETFTLCGKKYNIRHTNKNKIPNIAYKISIVLVYQSLKWTKIIIQSIKNIINVCEQFVEKHNLEYACILALIWSLTMGLMGIVVILALPYEEMIKILMRGFMFYLWGLVGIIVFTLLHLLCKFIHSHMLKLKQKINIVVSSVDEVV